MPKSRIRDLRRKPKSKRRMFVESEQVGKQYTTTMPGPKAPNVKTEAA